MELKILEEEHLLITGSNGAGKTQLLQAILDQSPVLLGECEAYGERLTSGNNSNIQGLSFLSHQQFLRNHGSQTVVQVWVHFISNT